MCKYNFLAWEMIREMILNLMEVSAMSYKCTYCVFTLHGSSVPGFMTSSFDDVFLSSPFHSKFIAFRFQLNWLCLLLKLSVRVVNIFVSHNAIVVSFFVVITAKIVYLVITLLVIIYHNT